jgi:hypothetical protein
LFSLQYFSTAGFTIKSKGRLFSSIKNVGVQKLKSGTQLEKETKLVNKKES